MDDMEKINEKLIGRLSEQLQDEHNYKPIHEIHEPEDTLIILRNSVDCIIVLMEGFVGHNGEILGVIRSAYILNAPHGNIKQAADIAKIYLNCNDFNFKVTLSHH